MKNKKTFIARLATVSLAAVVSAGIAAFLPISVKADGDISSVKATMKVGASVKIADEYANRGMKYTYYVSESDYQILSGYEDVVYGVFIAPSYYNEWKAIADENNIKSVYTWGDDDTQGKVKILNAYTNTLTKDDENGYRFEGGVVNMLEKNLLTEYIGVGYIKYTADGESHYIFAENNAGENNIRSMVYVAQRHLEAHPDADGLDEYLTEDVKAAETSYVNEYYVKNGSGAYTLKYIEKVETDVKVNANATIADKTIANYKVEEDNENNVKSGIVYANGKRTFRLYYTFNVPAEKQNVAKGLIETSATKELTTDFIEGLNYKLYKAFGYDSTDDDGNIVLKETEVEGFAFESNGNVDLTSLDGQYVAKALAGEEVIQTVSFDAYNKNNKFEWNNDLTTATYKIENNTCAVTETIVDEAQGRTGKYVQIQYTVNKNGDNYTNCKVYLAPTHSKAYYEVFKDTFKNVTFDFYYNADSAVENPKTSCVYGVYGANSDAPTERAYRTNYNVNVWNTVQILPITYLIENYNNFVDETEKFTGFESLIYDGTNFHRVTNSTIYFGDINVDFNLSDSTADNVAKVVKKTDVVNVAGLMGETNQAIAEQYSAYIDTILIDGAKNEYKIGSSIDMSNYAEGCYKISVKIGSQELASGYIYSCADGDIPVYNTVGVNEKDLFVDAWINEGINSVESIEVISLSNEDTLGDRTSGSYYSIKPKDVHIAQVTRFALKPVLPKSVYETYYAEYSNAKLVFDIYVKVEDAGTVTKVRVDTLSSASYQNGYFDTNLNSWKELSISLDNIINGYDNIGTRVNSNANALFSVGGGWDGQYVSDVVYYVGNFRIVSGD